MHIGSICSCVVQELRRRDTPGGHVPVQKSHKGREWQLVNSLLNPNLRHSTLRMN